MTLFIQDNPWDYLMYLPIMKEMDSKHKEWKLLNLTGKSISDLVLSLSTIKTERVVIYGSSELKVTTLLLCRGMGIESILLEGSGRIACPEDHPQLNAILRLMPTLATVNLVSSINAKELLVWEGVKVPCCLFESPITSLARKSVRNNKSEKSDKILVCVDDSIRNSVISSIKSAGKESISYDPKGLDDSTKIYADLMNCGGIVSDNFIFDLPAANLGKHFFFVGNEDDIIHWKNLGISTHIVSPNSKKKELQDYIVYPWSQLVSSKPEFGMQSLMKFLD